jgi:mRNA degradation ribonuclease J1/J2
MDASGRVYVTLFSSNVYRIAELMRLAHKANRFVCLAGRSLQGSMELASNLQMFSRNIPEVNQSKWIDAADINKHPPHSQMIICSGSQGENRSALTRLANGVHSDFLVESGDTVIFSSKAIPGNEKAISRVINGLLRQGAKVLWSDLARSMGVGPIHASGHARRDEIKAVASLLKPHFIVPVHGELRQLESNAQMLRELGEEWGLERGHVVVVENGARLDFSASGQNLSGHSKWKLHQVRRNESVMPRILRFAHFTSPSRDSFLKVRKRAALGGVVSAWIDATGQVGASVFGVSPETKPLMSADVVEKWLMSQYKHLKSSRAFDGSDHDLENQLAEELARHVRRLCGVRPFTVVHVIGD